MTLGLLWGYAVTPPKNSKNELPLQPSIKPSN